MHPADIQSALMTVPSLREKNGAIFFPRCNDYIGGTTGGSVVSIYIDGTRMFPPLGKPEPQELGVTSPMGRILSLVAVKDIQAIEVFKGVAQLPAEFNDNACAVIAIWTRSY